MQLFDLWTNLETTHDRPAFQRVDDKHPLDMYASIDVDGVRGLMLLASQEPPAPPSYDILSVSKSLRADGKWVLLIRLAEPSLKEPFAYLCADLVESSRLHISENEASQYILSRLTRWRRMMEIAKRGLSEEELRGLIGELLLLRDRVLPIFGISIGINGWVGPLKAPKDFMLPRVEIEAKTIHPGTRSIIISSIDQLSTVDNRLILALIALSPSQIGESGAFSVRELVESIRDKISTDPAASDEFERRLFDSGYSDAGEYANDCFTAENISYYDVLPDFPRITFATVPVGVISARYQIDLPSIIRFEIKKWTIGE